MRSLNVLALLSFSGLSLTAQTVVSAHSGVVHLAEGAVSIDGKPVNQQVGTFPDWKEKSELRTEAGRVEILLTPGVFLRVGENSAVRLIDNRLVSTRVELISGKAVVESDDPMKENGVTMVVGDYEVQVRKSSIFGLDTDPAQLKVYHGEADVAYKGEFVTVKAGRLLPFSAALASEKFDAKEGDDLTRWSQRRSAYVAAANVSSAKTLKDNGTAWNSNGWFYNPYYSMYTYIPGSGSYFNPYGYGFYSPYSVYNYLPYYGGGYYGGRGAGGFNGSGHTGDQSGSFGRNTTTSTTAANSGGFGRTSAPAAPSHGGSFSGGGNIGGGSRGTR